MDEVVDFDELSDEIYGIVSEFPDLLTIWEYLRERNIEALTAHMTAIDAGDEDAKQGAQHFIFVTTKLMEEVEDHAIERTTRDTADLKRRIALYNATPFVMPTTVVFEVQDTQR